MYVKRNNEALLLIHCCDGKAINIRLFSRKCVFVVLGTQNAMLMGHIFICFAFLVLLNFSNYLKNSMIFEKTLLNKKHVNLRVVWPYITVMK